MVINVVPGLPYIALHYKHKLLIQLSCSTMEYLTFRTLFKYI